MYYYMDTTDSLISYTTRNIFRYLLDGGVQSFPDMESNTGPERAAYLEWLAEGNIPEPWEQ